MNMFGIREKNAGCRHTEHARKIDESMTSMMKVQVWSENMHVRKQAMLSCPMNYFSQTAIYCFHLKTPLIVGFISNLIGVVRLLKGPGPVRMNSDLI